MCQQVVDHLRRDLYFPVRADYTSPTKKLEEISICIKTRSLVVSDVLYECCSRGAFSTGLRQKLLTGHVLHRFTHT